MSEKPGWEGEFDLAAVTFGKTIGSPFTGFVLSEADCSFVPGNPCGSACEVDCRDRSLGPCRHCKGSCDCDSLGAMP